MFAELPNKRVLALPLSTEGLAVSGAGQRPRSLLPLLPLVLVPLVLAPCWRGSHPGFFGPSKVEKMEVQGPPVVVEDDTPSKEKPAPGMLPKGLQLAVFDLAGTTLDDRVDGQPLAVAAICSAFERAGLEVHSDAVTAHRGLEKKEAIRRILHDLSATDAKYDTDSIHEQDGLVDEIYSYFNFYLEELLRSSTFSEMPGTSAAFDALRKRGVRIVITSGFAIHVVQEVVQRIGWDVDAVVFAQRPRPGAIHKAMELFQVDDAKAVLKVGDTVADVEEGRAAGAFTVAVLTGTQPHAALHAAGPDLVLGSVADIPGALPAAS